MPPQPVSASSIPVTIHPADRDSFDETQGPIETALGGARSSFFFISNVALLANRPSEVGNLPLYIKPAATDTVSAAYLNLQPIARVHGAKKCALATTEDQ
jgi:hypothetical protein